MSKEQVTCKDVSKNVSDWTVGGGIRRKPVLFSCQITFFNAFTQTLKEAHRLRGGGGGGGNNKDGQAQTTLSRDLCVAWPLSRYRCVLFPRCPVTTLSSYRGRLCDVSVCFAFSDLRVLLRPHSMTSMFVRSFRGVTGFTWYPIPAECLRLWVLLPDTC